MELHSMNSLELHQRESAEERNKMRGSKYVQSDLEIFLSSKTGP